MVAVLRSDHQPGFTVRINKIGTFSEMSTATVGKRQAMERKPMYNLQARCNKRKVLGSIDRRVRRRVNKPLLQQVKE